LLKPRQLFRITLYFLFNRTTLQEPKRYATKTWSVFLLNKIKYIYCYLKCIIYDKLLKPRQSFRINLYFLFNRTILQETIRYVTKTWSVVVLNKKKYIYSHLKCIVYDKLLKPRQSFRITLYFLFNRTTLEEPIRYVTKTWSVVVLNNKKNTFTAISSVLCVTSC